MAEYREIRARHTLLDICRSPELSTIVTLQPLRRIDLDAAIVFSDLLLPLEPMGIPFDFVRGEGPAIESPLRSEADIDRLKCFEPRDALSHVLQAIRMEITTSRPDPRANRRSTIAAFGLCRRMASIASSAVSAVTTLNWFNSRNFSSGRRTPWSSSTKRTSGKAWVVIPSLSDGTRRNVRIGVLPPHGGHDRVAQW